MYTFHFNTYSCVCISVLGFGWGPSLIETEEEWNFLRVAMGRFVGSYDTATFVGGSTNYFQHWEFFFDYDQYSANETFGKIIPFLADQL